MELSGALCWKSTGFLNIGNQMEIMFHLKNIFFSKDLSICIKLHPPEISQLCLFFIVQHLCIYDYFQI